MFEDFCEEVIRRRSDFRFVRNRSEMFFILVIDFLGNVIFMYWLLLKFRVDVIELKS